MHTKHLIERFARVGLDLRAANEPFAPNAEMFQMDIRRDRWNRNHEYFLVWRGHEDNLVDVRGIDRDHHQVVMMVGEPKRQFNEEIPQWMTNRRGWRKQIAESSRVSVDDIFVAGGRAFVRRSTGDNKRHLLAGRDERQLFMCRLPEAVTSVAEAHRALRPREVDASRESVLRQGEWFFLALPQKQLDELVHDITHHRVWARRKVSIGSVIPRAGKPHVAGELIEREGKVYVRGAIRHADHATIVLREWHQVVRNREVDENRSLFGGTWID